MSNNLMCSCGKPAQIACKCLSNLNFFCFAHLEQHMLNDPDNHIPLAISHALMMHDPESKSRSMQLDKIEMNLLNYEKELEAHISSLSSTHNNLKQVIDNIFQDYYTKYSKTLNDVKELRNKVEWYKIRDLEQATAMIEKYKSSKVRGILPSYHDISPINIVDILQSLAIEFGLYNNIILKSGNKDGQESILSYLDNQPSKPPSVQALNPPINYNPYPPKTLIPDPPKYCPQYPSNQPQFTLNYHSTYSYRYIPQNQPPNPPQGNPSEEQEVMNMLAMDPLFMKCPAEKCFYVIYNENKSLVLDCPRCKQSYCLKCKKISHLGETCNEFRGNNPPQYQQHNPGISYNSQPPKRVGNTCLCCGDNVIGPSVTLRCGDVFHRECISRYVRGLLSSNTHPKCICDQPISQQEIQELLR